jgi:hypothetical protein
VEQVRSNQALAKNRKYQSSELASAKANRNKSTFFIRLKPFSLNHYPELKLGAIYDSSRNGTRAASLRV